MASARPTKATTAFMVTHYDKEMDNKEETILRYRNASSLSLDTITSGISAISDIFTDATPPNRRRFGSHADLSDLIPALRQDQVEHEMKADPWAPEHPEQAKEATEGGTCARALPGDDQEP